MFLDLLSLAAETVFQMSKAQSEKALVNWAMKYFYYLTEEEKMAEASCIYNIILEKFDGDFWTADAFEKYRSRYFTTVSNRGADYIRFMFFIDYIEKKYGLLKPRGIEKLGCAPGGLPSARYLFNKWTRVQAPKKEETV